MLEMLIESHGDSCSPNFRGRGSGTQFVWKRSAGSPKVKLVSLSSSVYH